jgi:alpha-D-ribose 1-methylphosphonate 5-triphosphate synthase subunit PhnG
MGLFRYIVQGFGWEIGSQAAREGIDALRDALDEDHEHAPVRATAVVDPREQAKLERKRRRDVEAQLAALKREAKKRS